jgi:hypothetical protein
MHRNKDFEGHDINYYAVLLCLVFPITIDQAFYMLEGTGEQELSTKDIEQIEKLREQMRLHKTILFYEEEEPETIKSPYKVSLHDRFKMYRLEDISCKLNRLVL